MTGTPVTSHGFARRLSPELMDDPALDGREHAMALRGLARLNRLSGSSRLLRRGLRDLLGPRTDADVLDIATGSGDLLIDLASRKSPGLRLRGCDLSPLALDIARRDASARGVEIDFFRHDAIRGGALPECDIAMSSLFLHHLDRDGALALLRSMRAASRLGVLVNDMRRTRSGVTLAWAASRLFTRSRVVRTDAVLSARAAWTLAEARGLFEEAGMPGADITPAWPSRFLATWRRRDA
ncbi:MAG: methyltransferase domain-containing protein [Phycisphaerales bacterium]